MALSLLQIDHTLIGSDLYAPRSCPFLLLTCQDTLGPGHPPAAADVGRVVA
jgi:hypothetical protein